MAESINLPAFASYGAVVYDPGARKQGFAWDEPTQERANEAAQRDTYSPDMNPIEMAFAKLKTLLRQAQERTRDGLWQRIGTLLDQFTLEECANYFQAAGYGDSL